MRWALALCAMSWGSVASASPKTDVGKTFQAFVDSAGTADAAALELFIPPQGDSPDEHFEWPVLPKDKGEARGYLDHPKVVVKKLAISASGTSAWLAAEIKQAKPLRASAFLVKDAQGWHVTAAAWSRAATPVKPAQCKSLAFEWRPHAQVPDAAREPVIAVMKTLGHDFTKAMAPGGVIFGVGSEKPDFATWKVTGPWHEQGKDLSARANIAPDGQLAWMALEVGGPTELCTDYRAFYVVAKDKTGWHVVHQHYSLPAMSP